MTEEEKKIGRITNIQENKYKLTNGDFLINLLKKNNGQKKLIITCRNTEEGQ